MFAFKKTVFMFSNNSNMILMYGSSLICSDIILVGHEVSYLRNHVRVVSYPKDIPSSNFILSYPWCFFFDDVLKKFEFLGPPSQTPNATFILLLETISNAFMRGHIMCLFSFSAVTL